MARRRFFVDQVVNGKAVIEGENAHHLTRVLRVEAGQKFEITDRTRVWLAEVEAARKNTVEFAIVEELHVTPELPAVTLYLALIKFDRFEWAVEKATELGVAAIVPVEASRTDQGLFEGAKKRVERWRRIAHEASEQSRRLRIPEIADPVRLAGALARPTSLKIWLDEQPGAPPLIEVTAIEATAIKATAIKATAIKATAIKTTGIGETALLIGPEGGWTPAERTQIPAAGWTGASLGPPILRAETAVCAALAVVLQAHRAVWGS